MVAIAESFASQGARQEDPGHGTGIPMNNRYFGPADEQQVFWHHDWWMVDCIQGCQGLEWCRLGYPPWELWIKHIPGRYLFSKNAWKTKNMSTSSWIQRGPARACGELEMGPKSFLAGVSCWIWCPSTRLLTLLPGLQEDSTRNRIFTPCASSWTGAQLIIRRATNAIQEPVGRSSNFTGEGAGGQTGLLWQVLAVSSSCSILSISVELGFFKWSTTAKWG